MKLKVEIAEGKDRLNVLIKESVVGDIREYIEFAESKSGAKLTQGYVTEAMLEQFMSKDKAFQAFKKSNAATPAPGPSKNNSDGPVIGSTSDKNSWAAAPARE